MLNKLIVEGRVGNHPQLNELPDGNKVCNFSMAHNERFTNGGGERVERVTWFRVSVWNGQAQAVHSYVNKGDPVSVMGKLIPDNTGNPRIWVGNDGIARASFEIRAQEVNFLATKEESEARASQDVPADQVEEDEIPF